MSSFWKGSFWDAGLYTSSFFGGVNAPAGGKYWSGRMWSPSLFATTFFQGVPVAPPPPPPPPTEETVGAMATQDLYGPWNFRPSRRRLAIITANVYLPPIVAGGAAIKTSPSESEVVLDGTELHAGARLVVRRARLVGGSARFSSVDAAVKCSVQRSPNVGLAVALGLEDLADVLR